MSPATLLRAAWVCHALLLATVLLGLLAASFEPVVRVVLAAAAAVPLLLAVPGLRRGSLHTFQWLAFALVGYAGAAVVEVVASLGASAPAAVVLFTAMLELGLLYLLSRSASVRRRASRSRGTPE